MSEGTESQVYNKRYKVENKLGVGSFGAAYLVTDLKAKNESKVLKVIHLGEVDDEQTESSVDEAKILSNFNNPYIVKFYESFYENDCLCIVTEYCEGGDLDQRVKQLKKQKTTLPEEQIVEWLIQILLGVQYIHKANVLHRDLKARNIFFKSNQIKIGDFGISKVLMGTMDIATTFTGTPYYMSPEVLKHDGYGSKADIWSVGCLLYEMCALEHAFDGKGLMNVIYKVVEGKVPEIPRIYSKALDNICKKMLSKDPTRRPTAAQLLETPFIIEHRQRTHLDGPLENTINGRERRQNISGDLQMPVTHGQMKDAKWKVRNKITSNDDADDEPEDYASTERNDPLQEEEDIDAGTLKASRTVRPGRVAMGDKTITEANVRDQFNDPKARSNTMDKNANRPVVRENKLGSVIQSKSFANPAEPNGRTNSNRGRNPSPEFGQASNPPRLGAKNAPFNASPDDRPLTPMKGTYRDAAEDFAVKDDRSPSDVQRYDRGPTRRPDLREKFTKDAQRVSSGSQRSTMKSLSYTIDPRQDPGPDYQMNRKSLVHTIGGSERSVPSANACYDDDNTNFRYKSDREAFGPDAKEKKINLLRTKAIRSLGEGNFQKVYAYLVKQRTEHKNDPSFDESEISRGLAALTNKPNDCFIVDQLVFLELN